tara:strand:- start:1024 stop:1650 length:627 start_codon:yes stop_codon:yes gene_type:complete
MPRNVGNSSVTTALNSGQIKTAHLFEAVLFDTANNVEEIIYATDNNYNINHSDNTYYALGYLLSISGLQEFNDSRIASLTVTLTGVDENLVGSILQYQYLDRPCKVQRIFLSESKTTFDEDTQSVKSAQLLDEPITIFEGTIETPVITESQSSGEVTVQLSASSRFSEFTLKSGRHTNPQEQKFYSFSDKLFDMVGKIDQNLVWGQDA